jgi:hypothetical protein
MSTDLDLISIAPASSRDVLKLSVAMTSTIRHQPLSRTRAARPFRSYTNLLASITLRPINNTSQSIQHQQSCLSSAQPPSANSRPFAPRRCALNAPPSPPFPACKQPQTTALARATLRVRTPKTRARTLPPTWSTRAHHRPRRARAVVPVPPRAARRRPTQATHLSSQKVRRTRTNPSRRSRTQARLRRASRQRSASTTNRWIRGLRLRAIRSAVKNRRRTRLVKISGRVSSLRSIS